MFFYLTRSKVYPWEEINFNKLFFLLNPGSKSNVAGIDVNIIPAWRRNLSGKGIKMNYITVGFNPDHADFQDRFFANESFNFLYDCNDVTLVNPYSLIRGTAFVGGGSAGLNGKGSIGPAYESLISVSVVPYAFSHIDQLIRYLYYYPEKSHIRVIESLDNVIHVDNEYTDFVFRAHPKLDEYVRWCQTGGLNGKSVINVLKACIEDHISYSSSLPLFINYGDNIAVGSCTSRGGAFNWAVLGSFTLVTAPMNGNYDSSYNSETFYYPYLHLSYGYSRTEAIDLRSNELPTALVAGIIALLLEQRPDFTSQDVRYILIHSATINDPTSTMWETNAAGYLYHPIHGFGLVDAGLATEIAASWSNLQRQTEVTLKYEGWTVIPWSRQGVMCRLIPVNTRITFLEYIELRFDLNISEISALRIFLTSPQGSKRQLTYPNRFFSNKVEAVGCPIQLLARNYFGENPNGDWVLEIISSSYQHNEIGNISLKLVGHSVAPQIPNYKKRRVAESTLRPISNSSRMKLTLESQSWKCNTLYSVSLSCPTCQAATLPLFFVNKTTSELYHLNKRVQTNGSPVSVMAPCKLASSDDMLFGVLDFPEGELLTVPFSFENTYPAEGYVEPQVYDQIHAFQQSPTAIIINWSVHTPVVMPYISHAMRIAAYSYSNRRLLSERISISPFRQVSTIPIERTSERVIIIITPLNQPHPSPCNDMIIPVSLVVEGDPIDQEYTIPLNSHCPLPDGIVVGPDVTPTPKPPAPSNTNYILILVATLVTLTILAGLVTVIIYRLKKRKYVLAESSDAPLLWVTD